MLQYVKQIIWEKVEKPLDNRSKCILEYIRAEILFSREILTAEQNFSTCIFANGT